MLVKPILLSSVCGSHLFLWGAQLLATSSILPVEGEQVLLRTQHPERSEESGYAEDVGHFFLAGVQGQQALREPVLSEVEGGVNEAVSQSVQNSQGWHQALVPAG